MTDKVISMMPQLLCKQLARDLDRFLGNFPDASPTEMLGKCERILEEIGAMKDANGVWRMPDGESCS
jgi:hypothetical protein